MFATPDPTASPELLAEAVAGGNVPTLLMVLFHLTGNRQWLSERYRPTRMRGLDENDTAGLADEVQEEIRKAAAVAIMAWHTGQPPAVSAPDLATVAELLTISIGEPVELEYAAMLRAQLGLEKAPEPPTTPPAAFTVAIVGGGVSGLLAALSLRRSGIEHVVLEKSKDVGGTWHDNRYPGAGVDTPSYLYEYSFYSRDWASHFARQEEIHTYIRSMIEDFDLRREIQFDSEVVAASYDAGTQRWNLEIRHSSDGSSSALTVNAVITATGLLNIPRVPEIPGLDLFRGEIIHSARWPDRVDLTGRRVVVIGTGASAMQIVTSIADRVKRLTVFQRTPQWVAPVPKLFEAVPPAIHWLVRHAPFYREWYRARQGWIFNDRAHAYLHKDPDWPYPDRAVSAGNDRQRAFLTTYLEEHLADRSDLQEICRPSYPPFTKRMLLDHGWFEAIQRPNVDLVPLGVDAITVSSVTGSDGRTWPADVIILCTGFRPQTPLFPMEIRGRSGETIRDVWGWDNPSAYLGTTVPDFPNFFMVRGPNTTPGGGSSVFITECQIDYISQLIQGLVANGGGAIEVRREVHDEYNVKLQSQHARMVWSHRGAESYYRNARGKVVVNMPWRVVDYWRMTHEADLNEYRLESPL